MVINYMPGAGGSLAWTKFAQAKPGKLTVGISANFSGHHMASLQFEKTAAIKLTQGTFTGADLCMILRQ